MEVLFLSDFLKTQGFGCTIRQTTVGFWIMYLLGIKRLEEQGVICQLTFRRWSFILAIDEIALFPEEKGKKS